LCVKVKEWERLGQRVYSAKLVELEALSHYCTEAAAKALAKKNPLAAAKLYRALGLAAPAFYHCPLATNKEGARLAKRDASLSLRTLRAQGLEPEAVRQMWKTSDKP